jgi:hypothetical protein
MAFDGLRLQTPDIRDRSRMEVTRARVLLSRNVMRGLGAVMVSMITSGLHSGCLIPPDGHVVPRTQNFPPEIEIETLDPPDMLFIQNHDFEKGNCLFDLAATIKERENCFVDIRLVADNRRPSVHVLYEDYDVRLSPRTQTQECPPPPYRRRIGLDTQTQNFTGLVPTEGGGFEEEAHTITLFVKDTTTDWAVDDLDAGTSSATLDAGALLPATDGAPIDGSVVSYNWTVVFEPGSCN